MLAVLGSIVVSIPVCHAGDRGSIPHQGAYFSNFPFLLLHKFSLLKQSATMFCFSVNFNLSACMNHFALFCTISMLLLTTLQSMYIFHEEIRAIISHTHYILG